MSVTVQSSIYFIKTVLRVKIVFVYAIAFAFYLNIFNQLSEYINIHILTFTNKHITLLTSLLVFKIAKSLQGFFKERPGLYPWSNK